MEIHYETAAPEHQVRTNFIIGSTSTRSSPEIVAPAA